MANGAINEGASARRRIFTGTGVSSGIAIGKALFLHKSSEPNNSATLHSSANPESEIKRLQVAIDEVCKHFEDAKSKLATENPAQADILDAHILICRDPKLFSESTALIKAKQLTALEAWETAVQAVVQSFEGMASTYMRERANDVRSIAKRVKSVLLGEKRPELSSQTPAVLFASDLSPADTLNLDPSKIIGIVTEMGGKTSHTGILARNLNLPCVVGVNNIEEGVETDDLVIVDGIEGFVILNPSEVDIARYSERKQNFEEFSTRISSMADQEAETLDGVRVIINGNLKNPSETSLLKSYGKVGVGLYRTEISFLSRQVVPNEDELFEEYKAVIEGMAPARVIIRTLDLGADKVPAITDNADRQEIIREDNPALGLRGIRYCMRNQHLFRRQMRALLRAAAYGNAAIMFPMISGLRELQLAKVLLAEVRQELENEGLPHASQLPVGTMIELPSTVFVAGDLAGEVDFFSIGTNDLIQYTLGVDRGNKYVNQLFQPLHPAIIRSIKYVVDRAHQAGIPVGVCGEMAADPFCLPVLLGMGVDELSMSPQAIPLVKQIIRHSSMEEFKELTRQIFYSKSPEATLRLVRQCMYARCKDELAFFSSLINTGA